MSAKRRIGLVEGGRGGAREAMDGYFYYLGCVPSRPPSPADLLPPHLGWSFKRRVAREGSISGTLRYGQELYCPPNPEFREARKRRS